MESRFSITVDKYVIMPNHIHLLLSTAGEGAVTRAEQSPAPTTDAPCFQMSILNSLHPFSHVARMTSSTSSPRMAAMRSATRRT